jgi:hypothetical protein
MGRSNRAQRSNPCARRNRHLVDDSSHRLPWPWPSSAVSPPTRWRPPMGRRLRRHPTPRPTPRPGRRPTPRPTRPRRRHARTRSRARLSPSTPPARPAASRNSTGAWTGRRARSPPASRPGTSPPESCASCRWPPAPCTTTSSRLSSPGPTVATPRSPSAACPTPRVRRRIGNRSPSPWTTSRCACSPCPTRRRAGPSRRPRARPRRPPAPRSPRATAWSSSCIRTTPPRSRPGCARSVAARFSTTRPCGPCWGASQTGRSTAPWATRYRPAPPPRT